MRVHSPCLLSLLFQTLASSQQVGSYADEVHPSLDTQRCLKRGGCKPQSSKVVLDANWRWLHEVGSESSCFDNGSFNSTLCPDPQTCAQNCALEGADYADTYGIVASGGNLTLSMFAKGAVGTRVYLLADDSRYRMFKLKNKEFTFDVDVSGLPCGSNGAVYFSEMPADGGKSAFPDNAAGAAYGTGYCDAQCPQAVKFINGEANLLDFDQGSGRYGACCAEMDIWEANSVSTSYTPHPCTISGLYRCDGANSTDCGSEGVCDKIGCDFNPYRLGRKMFYGKRGILKTGSPNVMTVVTQFITRDGTATGDLIEIKRLYVQGGKVISNASSKIPNVTGNSITNKYCAAEKTAFAESNTFRSKGGLKAMGEALERGMVLTMSVWVDDYANMLWLDSSVPPDGDPATPGVKRGTCPTDSGKPADIREQYPDTKVMFSNIKFGDIGTTYS